MPCLRCFITHCLPGEKREADGYDETVLEGERGDSLDAAGFEHPYGRGDVLPARVIALSPHALAQVPCSPVVNANR